MTKKFTLDDYELAALIVAADVAFTNWLMIDAKSAEDFVESRCRALPRDVQESRVAVLFAAIANAVSEALNVPAAIAAMRLILAAKELHFAEKEKPSMETAERLRDLTLAIVKGHTTRASAQEVN